MGVVRNTRDRSELKSCEGGLPWPLWVAGPAGSAATALQRSGLRKLWRLQAFARAATLGVLALCAAATSSAALLYDIPSTSSGSPYAGYAGNWGFNFTLTTATTFSSIGLWDEGGDGLAGSHQVGIFANGTTLITSATVSNSSNVVSSTSTNGRWLFTDITPVTLQPGTYTLGFFNPSSGNDTFRGGVTASFLSGASFATGKARSGATSFAWPDANSASGGGWYGPNLSTTSTTPPLQIVGNNNLGSVPFGQTISGGFTVIGGTQPYTWSASGVPAGITVNNGAFTGTPTATGAFSFTITVTDAQNNSQTGTVSYTVSSATTTCSSLSTFNNLVRAESKTELVGDVILGCTNTSTSTVTGTLTVTLNAPVTSKAVSGSITEAAVVITDTSGTNSTQQLLGTVSGSVVTFTNVAIPPSTLRSTTYLPFTLQITNIRVDATTLGISVSPLHVTESIAFTGVNISASGLTGLSTGAVSAGLAAQSVTSVQNFPTGSAVTAAAPIFNVKFGENIPNAFKTQGSTGANSALNVWLQNNTETGYYVSTGTGNLATSATRLRVIFTNVPANLLLYVPLTVATDQSGAGSMTLTSTEGGAYYPVSPAGSLQGYQGSAPLGLVSISGGTGEAVYEITAASISTQESYTVPVYALGTETGGASVINAVVSFAPVTATTDLPYFSQLSSSTTLVGSTFIAPLSFTTSTTLPIAELSTPYSQSIGVTGGLAPYTWGYQYTLPQGISVNPSTGAITGTFTSTGTYTITVTATDQANTVISQAFSVTVNPALVIQPTTPPAGALNESYTYTPVATGGVQPVSTWAIFSGSIPTGLSFNTSTGKISGTPSASGTFNFTLKAFDSGGYSATQAFTITINGALTISTTSFTLVQGVTTGNPSLTVTGGVGGYTCSLVPQTALNGTGLSFSSSCVLSGTPATAGTLSLTFQASDTATSVTKVIPVQIIAPVSITTTTLPNPVQGASYSQTLATSGGNGTNTWSIYSGGLPAYLTLNANTGVISGTASGTGTYNFTVQVSSGGTTANQSYQVTLVPAVSINFPSTVDASSPLAFFQFATGSAGTSDTNSYTYNFAGSAAYVTGPTAIPNSGSAYLNGTSAYVSTNLSGGITTAGSIMAWFNLVQLPSLTGHVNYVAGESQVGNDLDLQIETDNSIRFYTTNNSQSLQYAPNVNGFAGSWHFLVATFDNVAGKRAIYLDGVQVASDTTQSIPNKTTAFQIGSSPVFSGRYFYGALAEVGIWNTALSPLQVAQFYGVTQSKFPAAMQNSAYGPLTLGAAGGSGSYSWSATGLPAGVTLSTLGALSGTPTVTGTFSPQITVKDTVTNQTSAQTYSLAVSSAIVISPSTLPSGLLSSAYSQQLSATGGSGGGYTWQIATGSLPTGLTLSVGGLLSGTPTASGTFTFTVQVTDSSSATVTQQLSLIVATSAPSITTTSLPNSGTAYAYPAPAMTATGGSGNYAWSATGLPAGLALSTTGVWSGTATTPGTSANVRITVTDTTSLLTATQTFSITIFQGAITTVPPGLQSGSPYRLVFYTSGTFAPSSTDITTYNASVQSIANGVPALASLGATWTVIASTATVSAATNIGATGTNVPIYGLDGTEIAANVTQLFSGTLLSGIDIQETGNYVPNFGIWTGSNADGSISAYPLAGSSGTIQGNTGSTNSRWINDGAIVQSSNHLQHFYAISSVLGVASLSITTSSLPSATRGTSYSQTLAASGGSGSGYSFTVTAGTVTQAGLSLASNGALTGTPTISGNLTFTVQVTDSALNTATQTFTLPIAPASTSAWNFAVANQASNIVSITPNSTTTKSICSGTTCHPNDIAADSQGNIYAHDGSGIVKISPAGTILWTTPLTGGYGGVAVDNSRGKVVFVDNSNDAIYTVNAADGSGLTKLAPFPVQSPSELQDTYVAVDTTDGTYFGTYVVVSDDSSTVKVWRFTAAGVATTVASNAGTAGGLIVDSSENYLYLDYSATALYKVNPTSGARTTVASGANLCGVTCELLGLTIDPGTGDYVIGSGYSALFRVNTAGALTVIYNGSALSHATSVTPVPATSIVTVPPSLSSGGKYRLIFVTSGTVDGTSTDINTYNTFVTSQANSVPALAALGTTWTVVGGTSAVTALTNIGPSTAPVYDLAGNLIGSSMPAICTAGQLGTQGVNLTPSGTAYNGYVWTGTSNTCGVQNRPLGGGTGAQSGQERYGDTTQINSNWLSAGNGTPGTLYPVYAISGELPPITITISPANVPSGVAGTAYGPVNFSATGGSGTYTWSASGLPAGWNMSASGVLSGNSVGLGTTTFTVTVTDTVNQVTASATYKASVSPAPPVVPLPVKITGGGTFNTAVGGSVSAGFSASGGVPPYSYSATGLPAGVSVNAANGAVSGSPSQAGNFSGIVTVRDSLQSSASGSITINVLGLASSGALASGTAGVAYSAAISAAGGLQPYSFTATGLPTGLTISPAGYIGGKVTADGTYSFSVRVTDSAGSSASGSFSITFAKPAPIVVSTSVAGGQVNTPFTSQLGITGGIPPYTVSISSGTPPAGTSLNSFGGLSGTPTTPGSYSFGVLVTDSIGTTSLSSVSVTIKASPVTITTPSPLPAGMATIEYPGAQFSATGGFGTFTWSAGSGLPPGLSLSSDGTLSGTPSGPLAQQQSYSFTVTATDAAANTGSATYSITVRPFAADLALSTGSLSFTLNAPAAVLPFGNSVGVESTQTQPPVQLGFTVAKSASANWLSVSSGGTTPAVLSVSLNSAALSLPAGNYTAAVTVTCTTNACAGRSQNIAVSLAVVTTPPQLQILSDLLSYATPPGNVSPLSQTLSISNSGGGSLGVGSITCEASWCSVSGVPSTIAGGTIPSLTVTVNPAATGPGSFRTQVDVVTSAGRGSVPVTLFVTANPVMTLAPSGSQFLMQQGGAPGNSSGSFLVGSNSTTPVNWSAKVLPGATWLIPGVTSGSSSAGQSSSATYSIDPSVASKLPAGAYYGDIEVTASGVANSPQEYVVVLNVSPATTPSRPDPEPQGLLFLTTVGQNPGPRNVTIFQGSALPLTFQAQAASTGNWLSVSPNTGTTSLTNPAVTSVSVDTTGLQAGIYSGQVSYAFAGQAVRSTNVTLIVAAGTSTPATGASVTEARPAGVAKPLAGCTPGKLAIAQTGLVNNFSAPASWPTPIAVQLADDCGNAVSNGQIVATFSNGDAPMVLSSADPGHGLYAGTWTPRKTAAQVSISARATAPGLATATGTLAGAVTPNAAPTLTPNGTLGSFTALVGTSVAPGTIIQIYGQNLANLTVQPTTLPLPTTLNGTSVIIGGLPAPLFYVSPTQVNAQVPFELQGNQQYQVVLQANGAITTPQTLQLAPATPGIAAFGDGTIIAQHSASGALVSQSAPARSGEYLVTYLVGLGAVNQQVTDGSASPSGTPAQALDPPTLTLNGATYPIAFAGLTPGLVGLYQINFQVPPGLPAGNLTMTVTQDQNTSNQVFLPYQP